MGKSLKANSICTAFQKIHGQTQARGVNSYSHQGKARQYISLISMWLYLVRQHMHAGQFIGSHQERWCFFGCRVIRNFWENLKLPLRMKGKKHRTHTQRKPGFSSPAAHWTTGYFLQVSALTMNFHNETDLILKRRSCNSNFQFCFEKSIR